MRNRTVRVPRWRAPFLKALSETGNAKLAADRAPVHPSHIYRLRRRDPGFAADWMAAIKAAARKLGAQDSTAMPGCRGDALRGELVMFRTRTGKPHLRAPRANGWTRAKEKIFLKVLASTCNVIVAAKTAGVTPSAAYQRRLRWAGFEKAWAEALENGMIEIEHRLLEKAKNDLEYADDVVPEHMPLISIDHAIRLLTIHRRQLARDARRGANVQVATEKETYEALVRAMDKVAKQNARAADRAAKVAGLRAAFSGNGSGTAV